MQPVCKNKKRPLSKLPWLPLSLRKGFPPIPAVYFCMDDDNFIHYIGKTTNLKQRFASHHKLSNLDELGDLRIHFQFIEREAVSILNELEALYIAKINPPLNQRNGKGRRRRFS